jgi:hypothetical protein
MLSCAGLFYASSAEAERTRYRSAHPIPASVEGNFCYIDQEHTHTYTPDADHLPHFLQGARMEFVGDPSDWGYEGPLISYEGPHPFHFEGGSAEAEASCSTEGAHFHLHAPLDSSKYEERKGSYYFESYAAVMEDRRAKAELLKAEERALKKAERAERKERRSERRKSRRGSKARSSRSSSTTTVTRTVTPKPVVRPKKKPKKKGFRSWMDRRRGR